MDYNYTPKDMKEVESFVRRSTSGEASEYKPREYVSRERYNNAISRANAKIKRAFAIGLIAGLIGGSAVTTGITVGIPAAKEHHKQMEVHRIYVSGPVEEFQRDVIYPNRHRTQDNSGYYNDNEAIARELDTYGNGNFDENLYKYYVSEGSAQTSDLLNYTQYDSTIDTPDGPKKMSFRVYLQKSGDFPEGADIYDDEAYEQAQEHFVERVEAQMIIDGSMDEAEARVNTNGNDLDTMLQEDVVVEEKAATKGGL